MFLQCVRLHEELDLSLRSDPTQINPHERKVFFQYRTRLFWPSFGVFTFGALCWFMIDKALTDERGLVLYQAIETSAEGASTLYLAVGSLSGLLALGSLLVLVLGAKRREIVVSTTAISAPSRGVVGKNVEVAFSTIADVKVTRTKVSGLTAERFVEIVHSEGKLVLLGSMLRNRKQFEELVDLILLRISANGN